MSNAQIIYWLLQLGIGIYLLGLGFKFIPNPGKKDSVKNEDHFNKYRGVFKAGGVLLIAHVLLSASNAIL